MSDRKTELEQQIRALSVELNAIKDAEYEAENRALIGRCFKVRNNYSCPPTEADYWWLYTKATHVDQDGCLRCLEFEVDKDGEVRITPNRSMMASTLLSRKEVSAAEFAKAWDSCIGAAVGAFHGVPHKH